MQKLSSEVCATIVANKNHGFASFVDFCRSEGENDFLKAQMSNMDGCDWRNSWMRLRHFAAAGDGPQPLGPGFNIIQLYYDVTAMAS
jgi:hypothetical protein